MLLIKIIAFIYLLAPIASLLTILFDKIIKKKYKKIKTNNYSDIYVLLPALKEQKIVKDTIDWFKSMRYKGNIKYIIITSEKEELEYKTNKIKEKTTRYVVDKYLKKEKDDRFIHYHYNEVIGNKSSQLNYAIERIKGIAKDYENTYISVFDFDSRPEHNTFNELNKVIQNKKYPDEIQQIPLEIRNYKETSKRNLIMTMYSLQHMVRSLAIEKFRYQIYSLFHINRTKYFMGACMHLKLSTLIENDLFPIFVDDITLGYRYSIKRLRCEYLYSNNYSLIPNNLKGFFGSSTLIFKGILTFITEIKRVKGYLIGKIDLAIEGITNLLEFCVIPYIFLSYYIYSIITKNYSNLFIVMILIPILWSLSSYIVLKTNKIYKDNKIISILAIIASPIWYIYRPMGSIKYFFLKMNKILFKREIKYSKTER